MKKYDALFIFPGIMKEESLEQTVEKTMTEISRLGGTIENTEIMGRRNFARPTQRGDSGFYVKVRFLLEAANVAELRSRYRLNEDVFRVQILSRDERYDTKVEADKVRRTVYRAKQEAAKAEAAAAAAALAAEAMAEVPVAEAEVAATE